MKTHSISLQRRIESEEGHQDILSWHAFRAVQLLSAPLRCQGTLDSDWHTTALSDCYHRSSFCFPPKMCRMPGRRVAPDGLKARGGEIRGPTSRPLEFGFLRGKERDAVKSVVKSDLLTRVGEAVAVRFSAPKCCSAGQVRASAERHPVPYLGCNPASFSPRDAESPEVICFAHARLSARTANGGSSSSRLGAAGDDLSAHLQWPTTKRLSREHCLQPGNSLLWRSSSTRIHHRVYPEARSGPENGVSLPKPGRRCKECDGGVGHEA